ncbi:Sporulation stage III, protein AB [Alkaliphilus metalliredigens QYMF]|uniref:Sporulation stage III, protein AB n=1 Tax=Alkaliphilus metalliredigens (strain QYMF) TaxID=293826 RepID=A6TR28_ALKMQ|nr:stage III sporulation protein SpoIIIAB [Alkaliphilus metalliredigens]ABR48646.1 Sporulation stage III, protein AB [Alkaliphilus metalliredigens QYMF]
MILKLLLSILIVICSGLIGIIYAKAYIDRSKLLRDLISTLQMLETEIMYGATPLPELMVLLAAKSEREIARLFQMTAHNLQKHDGHTFASVWRKSVNVMGKETVLKERDIALLVSLGNNLGISDQENQVKHIRLTMEEMRRNYDEAIMLQRKNEKLYKSLGVLFGLTVVIVFF